MTSEELDWKSEYHDLATSVLEYEATARGERGLGWRETKKAREAMTGKARAALVKTAPTGHTQN
jgi:hypothetical protein